MYKSILVPLEGYEYSGRVLEHVERIAVRYQAKVIFLYVQEPSVMLGWDEVIDEDAYRQKRIGEKERIEAYLVTLRDEFQRKGIKSLYHIACGPTLESILKAAEETEGVLIALATHGLDDSYRSIHRSVAAGLLRKAEAPLLLLRGA